ncbi:MAG: ATP-dependent DNA helicase RecG [Acidimicrobiales bacterium]
MTEGLSLEELAAKPVTELAAIGETKARGLAQMGIENLNDLLSTYPRRYLDRREQRTIAQLKPGAKAMVLAQVRRVTSRRTRNRRQLTVVEVSDSSGLLTVTFFNQGWRAKQLPEGTEAVFFGECTSYRGSLQMTNPVVDLIGDQTGRIVAIYPQSDKARVSSLEISKAIAETLRRSQSRGFADPVPKVWRDRFGLADRTDAINSIHRPDSMKAKEVARQRLVFDELLRIQIPLIMRKAALEANQKGPSHVVDGPLRARFTSALPFVLTGAQKRAITEISDDLMKRPPMHRLLQGDVGSGKTLVAAEALLMAVDGSHQGALMAPTEVLAEQHLRSLRQLLEGLEVDDPSVLSGRRPLHVELLTGSLGAAQRRKVHAGMVDGSVDIVVGTHALISEGVTFASLGLVVVDEQHRFGVEQRAALREVGRSLRGHEPDVLVMTATPIPRTAAMTVYGDLDVSVLDELPPGRQPIETYLMRTEDEVADVWEAVRAQVASRRQAYVVCPLVKESERVEVRSVEQTFEDLETGPLEGLRLGLLHGRMSSAEKESTMSDFRSGLVDVLVATTVIEVGVDVPNATVMVVLDAQQFGIAQLHQLRGRVGRGSHSSLCYLVSDAEGDAEKRLMALVDSSDGFFLAEVDLDLRGEGTLMGGRQTGMNDLKLASLRRDKEWVAKARKAALGLVADDPELGEHADLLGEVQQVVGSDEQWEFLFRD